MRRPTVFERYLSEQRSDPRFEKAYLEAKAAIEARDEAAKNMPHPVSIQNALHRSRQRAISWENRYRKMHTKYLMERDLRLLAQRSLQAVVYDLMYWRKKARKPGILGWLAQKIDKWLKPKPKKEVKNDPKGPAQ